MRCLTPRNLSIYTATFLALVSLPFSLFGFSITAPHITALGQARASSADANLQKSRTYHANPSHKALEWADSQLRKMSTDEKIGQLVSIGVNATFLNQDSDAFRELRHQVVDNHVGGICLYRGPVYESIFLLNRMQELARFPLLVSSDLEAGAGMRFDDTVNFPWNMAVGATGNPELARQQGIITAREARLLGVQQIFAPVVDVNNNAANPVINVRSYGEDPVEVGRFAAAFVEGAQSQNVIATAKHFPGHGDTAIDSHRGLPVINVDLNRLNSLELVPFRAAIGAGVGSVMVGHIALPKIDPTVVTPQPRINGNAPVYGEPGSEVVTENGTMPATMSPVLGKMLRSDLGFQGMVVTDAIDMSGLTIYFNREEAAVRAILAGADMLLKPGSPDTTIKGLKDAVASGRISVKRIEESARRILAAKYDLGLAKQRITPVENLDKTLSSRDEYALASQIAEHAITLVRNDQHLVPLTGLHSNARIVNIAITNGDDRLSIAQPFAGTLAKAGYRVDTFTLDSRSSEREIRRALEAASHADLIIASLYGRVRTGQAQSVGLPDTGSRVLQQLIADKIPVVGVSFGNPYLLQGFPDLKTYLVAYGDMPSLQQAAARSLVGAIDITGRLPISLPSLYARGTGIQLKAQPQARNDTLK